MLSHAERKKALQEEAAQRTKVMLAMAFYDRLPRVARDIAKEFPVVEINRVRKALDLEEADLTEGQWERIGDCLRADRQAEQERIFRLGRRAFQH